MNPDLAPLFEPYTLGALRLENRIVMAPMTRGRADAGGIPNAAMAKYYEARASVGLIITEATAISPQGVGWVGAPGIYTNEHVAGWRGVTQAVHQKGGKIYMQLWHMGRVSHPDFLDGQKPWAPSALAAVGDAHTPKGKKPYVEPKAMTLDDIAATVAQYGQATARAKEAGFDGVELHGANGYLIDQFLRDGSNRRTDGYGGSIDNRLRFLREALQAAIAAWDAKHVGVRLSPVNTYNDMKDSQPRELFVAAARLAQQLGLAYLHVLEALPGNYLHVPHPEKIAPFMRKEFRGTLMVNGGYSPLDAARAIATKETDLVAIGVPILANPDFVERVRRGAAMNAPDMATFYIPGAKGYNDYPTLGN